LLGFNFYRCFFLFFSFSFFSFILFHFSFLAVKLVLHPIVRGTTSDLRAKTGQEVRCTHAGGKYFFGGRKQEAEQAA
jgi:hypothetical protein